MRLLRNCNSKHPLWLLHSHSLLDHTGMNNPLIYFFTVMHLPYAFISFLTQTEFQGQTFQSLSCIYPHLPHPSFVDWTSTLVKFVSAANVQALFLILSPQTVFKHLVSVLLFLWVPYLVTTQLLFRCSALASSTNSTHGPILHSLPSSLFLPFFFPFFENKIRETWRNGETDFKKLLSLKFHTQIGPLYTIWFPPDFSCLHTNTLFFIFFMTMGSYYLYHSINHLFLVSNGLQVFFPVSPM